jgi:hypothetical protein
MQMRMMVMMKNTTMLRPAYRQYKVFTLFQFIKTVLAQANVAALRLVDVGLIQANQATVFVTIDWLVV